MKKLVTSSILILSFIICASGQANTVTQNSASSKSVQTVDKTTLNKKTIVQPKGVTNWSKIKDLFR